MDIDSLITYIAQWAAFGAIIMVVLPKFKWKSQLTRRLYIFAAGPFVWLAWGIVLFGVRIGIPIEYWYWKR